MNVAALYLCSPIVLPWLVWWNLTSRGMAVLDTLARPRP